MSRLRLPHHLRGEHLRGLAELLPREFGDAEGWRAAHDAAREIMQAPSPRIRPVELAAV